MTALTKVILEGPLGKQFGREWELAVDSPNEALRMIDANKPGVFLWIRANLEKYSRYRVICEYEDGRKEELENEDYPLERKLKSVRFVPLIEGSGGAFKTVVGIVLIIASFIPGNPFAPYMLKVGSAMALGGVIEMLSARPRADRQDSAPRKDATSYYFDGPANTTMQGVPVQLIYGTVLVGSHAISAALTIDQLL